MEQLGTAFLNIGIALKLAKEASDAVDSANAADLNRQKEKLEIAAKKIERSANIINAELAKTFDYQLCKCTFPPQICVLIGHDEKTKLEISQCQLCSRKYPPVFGK